MRKNAIIIAMFLLMCISFLYAFFQQTAANKARIQAEKNLQLAEEARKDSDQTLEQLITLEQELKNCKAFK